MCLLHLLTFSISGGTRNNVGPEWPEVVVVVMRSWEEQAGAGSIPRGGGGRCLCTCPCAGKSYHARAWLGRCSPGGRRPASRPWECPVSVQVLACHWCPQGLGDAPHCVWSVEILYSVSIVSRIWSLAAPVLPTLVVALWIRYPTSAFLQLMWLIAHFCFFLQQSDYACAPGHNGWPFRCWSACKEKK